MVGQYAVFGEYDFVNIVDGPDNATVSRFSLELGVAAGVHVTTLPAIPIGRFEVADGQERPSLETEVSDSSPGE